MFLKCVATRTIKIYLTNFENPSQLWRIFFIFKRKMKFFITLLFCIAGLVTSAQTDNPNYDKELAQKLGADENGMKKFVLVLLKTGTNTASDKKTVSELFKGHMDNINRLADQGKLIVAGPMGKNDKTYRGIFILDVKSIDEARKLVDSDPAVAGKLLDAEFYDWYGGAALPEYLKAQDRITPKKP